MPALESNYYLQGTVLIRAFPFFNQDGVLSECSDTCNPSTEEAAGSLSSGLTCATQ